MRHMNSTIWLFVLMFVLQNVNSLNYHFIVLNYCYNCLKIQYSGRVLFNEPFVSEIKQSINNWKPYHSSDFQRNRILEIQNDFTLSRIEQKQVNGWKVLVQKEYISIKDGQNITEQFILQDIGPISANYKIILNSSLIQQSNQQSFVNSTHFIFVNQISQQSLNQIIQSTIIQKKYQDAHKRQQIQQLKESIQQMCDSNQQSDLLSDFTILLNHENRQYFNKFFLDIKKRVKDPCIKQKNVSHIFSIISFSIIICTFCLQKNIEGRRARNMSPI